MKHALILVCAFSLLLAVGALGARETATPGEASHTPNDMMSIRHSGGDPGPFGPAGTVLNAAIGYPFTVEIWVDAASAAYGGYYWEVAFDTTYVAAAGNIQQGPPQFNLCDDVPDTTSAGSFTIYGGLGCLVSTPSPSLFIGQVARADFECVSPTVTTTPVLLVAMAPSEDTFADPVFGTTLIEANGGIRNTSTRYKGPSPLGGMGAQITVRCLDAAADPDNDGCSNGEETGANPLTGGKRDPFDAYDFFDVPTPALSAGMPNGTRNKAVSLVDVGGPLAYVGTVNEGMPNPNGYDYDTDFNANTVDDGAEYDRTPSMVPMQPWRSGAPNGAVSLQDVGVALAQVGTNCSAAP